MLTSAHHLQHHHHLPQSAANMPVAASPCSTSSSSLGFHQATSSMSSSASDLLNSSNSSFGESSASSVRSSPKRSEQASSTSSSSMPRVRTIRLKRPAAVAATVASVVPQQQQSRNLLIGGGSASLELASHSSLFGFSLRGGSEYRTGFFVAHVEPGGEADCQGVQVGDQIIRVNNHPVDDATHKELSQYIANQSHLTLRVRNIGMIPVKDRDQDPLTWQMVHQDQKSSSSSDYDDVIQCRDIIVTLSLGPKEKLGLGICKGPEWKPGIFVQFTKDQGIARRAGLKPGDQILSCNGVEFQDIFFNDAVAVMKASSHLELIIRTAVGLELFPGESSGYNSSASSVTGGDQSPCWNEPGVTRRYDVEGRMNASKLKSPFKPKSSSGHRDRLMAVNTPKVPQLVSFQSQQMVGNNFQQPRNPVADPHQNTTIIKLSEEGTIINNTLIPNVSSGQMNTQKRSVNNSNKSATTVRLDSMQSGLGVQENLRDPRTTVVEVHRGEREVKRPGPIPPPPPMAKATNPTTAAAAAAIPSIADEIKKRAEKLQQKKQENGASIDERVQLKAKGNGLGNSDQHNQLMDEFKKAHQKMFKNGGSGARNLDEEVERQRTQQQRHYEIDRDQPDSCVPVKPTSTPALVYSSSVSPPKTMPKNLYLSNGKNSPSPPPPPPPETNGFPEAEISPPIEFADDVPKRAFDSSTLGKRTAVTKAPVDSREMEKPATPTPDYDSLVSNHSGSNGTSEDRAVKVGAIPPPPAPPVQSFNGRATATKAPAPPKPTRSISVTIGEYDSKREPSKLGFLNKSNQFNGGSPSPELLQNELQMTLSRSNLKKSSEGNKTNSVLEKTGSANVEKLTSMLNARNTGGNGNKVTISIPKTNGEAEVKNGTPNGILKSNDGGSVVNGETKNIKFDNIATVIGIRK